MNGKIILASSLCFLGGELVASAQLMVPGFDAARVVFTQTGDSDIDGDDGSFQVSRFQLLSLLSRPVTPADGLFILPIFDYKLTDFRFDGTPAGYPVSDEDLHSLSLSSFLLSMREGSPWIFGAWMRAELASDFQHIDGDDFTFDLAAGGGYRFNETFTLGAGAAVMNLNGDTSIYPGINLDWVASDQLRIGIYGPTMVVAYSPSEDWVLSFREEPLGGIWNITGESDESRSIKFTSIRLGLYLSRRLTDNLWLTGGGGCTVANGLDYTTPGGRKLDERDSGSSLFGTIGLRLKAW